MKHGLLVSFCLRRFDFAELVFSILHPCINILECDIKVLEAGDKLIDFVNLLLESAENLKFVCDSFNFLLNKVFFVFGQGHGHNIVIVLGTAIHTIDNTLGVSKDLLSLFQVLAGSSKIEAFLNLFDFFFSFVEFNGNVFKTSTIAFPGSLSVVQKGQSGRGLLLGLIPTLFNAANMAVQELGFVGVLKKLSTLGDEISDDTTLGLQLSERLLLSLNQLFNVFNTARSNVTCGAEHDSVQKFNVWFQLITIGVTFPVEINFNLSFEDGWDKLFVLF